MSIITTKEYCADLREAACKYHSMVTLLVRLLYNSTSRTNPTKAICKESSALVAVDVRETAEETKFKMALKPIRNNSPETSNATR